MDQYREVHRGFSVGSYVWSTDPDVRCFVRGVVEKIHGAPYDDFCTIKIDDAPTRLYAMMRGGRMRIRCSKLIAPNVLDRLAFEDSRDSKPKHHQWPSKHRLKMSI